MSSLGASNDGMRYHNSSHEQSIIRRKEDMSEEKSMGLMENPTNFVEEDEEELFYLRLIRTVKTRGCHYDERNENFNNEYYKNEDWLRIQNELNYEGGMPINVKWKNLLRIYMDMRRNNDQIPQDTSISHRVIEEMKFFDHYIFSTDVDGQTTITQDLMISGYDPRARRIGNDAAEISHSGPGYVVLQPQGNGSDTHQRDDTTLHSQKQHQQLSHNPSQQRRYSSSISNGRIIKIADSSVVHTDDPRKKTMYIDTSTTYQKDGKKLFRLFDAPSTSAEMKYVADPDQMYVNTEQIMPQSRKRRAPPHQIVRQHMVEERPMMAAVVDMNSGEIIDDGIQEDTIVIETDTLQSHSPLLGESPEVGSMMISGQSMSHRQPPPQQSQQQQHQSQQQTQHQSQQQQATAHITMHPSTSDLHVVSGLPRSPTMDGLAAPEQMQYDADLEFQQLISVHLSRMSEEDKAVMKFNIQRILLDARFGPRTAIRIMQEEDENEGMADTMDEMVDPEEP